MLFVGTEDEPLAASTRSTPPSSTTANPTTTTPTDEGSATTGTDPGAATIVTVPDTLTGRWRSGDGGTIVQFAGTVVESLQTELPVRDGSAAVVLAEVAELGDIPTELRPVQVVLFVTIETDTVLRGPDPVLAEFVFGAGGLQLTLAVEGVNHEFVLVPS